MTSGVFTLKFSSGLCCKLICLFELMNCSFRALYGHTELETSTGFYGSPNLSSAKKYVCFDDYLLSFLQYFDNITQVCSRKYKTQVFIPLPLISKHSVLEQVEGAR